MVFNSLEFWLFFAAAASLYFVLPRRFAWVFLLVASYVFYMWWNAAYIVLIAGSTLIDFVVGKRIHQSPERSVKKRWLLVSLIANLGALFTFKYWTFFHESVGALVRAAGGTYEVPHLGLLLPVGISFYTFQTLSYTIDIYRGQLAPESNLGRFALYVAYFPQLVAGPIERARTLLPQLRAERKMEWDRLVDGLQLALWGLFKKVVVADRLAMYVDAVYGNPGEHNATTLTLATYAFAFQIYGDFSGYSDIAIGVSRILGIDLMRNFEEPYFAQTIRDFWRRWHISLSTWLRDYLYIPLGGSRGSSLATYRNLLITMLLGGLWHGASWNFVVWGAIHGGILAVERFAEKRSGRQLTETRVPRGVVSWVRMLLVFHVVCFAWVFFRADTWDAAVGVLSGIAGGGWGAPFMDPLTFTNGLGGVALLLVVDWQLARRRGSTGAIEVQPPMRARWVFAYVLLLAVVFAGVESGSQFIYFQF
ncbi:MAG: MBOAT family protein [Deltaproteobacteria bacterium]|nr:MBOAT family protein [Deltaproteobacteria bacterium]